MTVPPLLTLMRERYRRADAWYQQRWFRYGQIALRSGTPVPNLRRLRAETVPDHDIAPGVMVVQKDAERDRVHLWIGAVLYDQLTDVVEAHVELAPRDGGEVRRTTVALHRFGMESEKAVTCWSPGTRFFHTHVTFTDVPPDAWYAATVTLAERPQPAVLTARCRARTLPDGLVVGAPPLQVFTASCYDVDTDMEDRLDAAYRTLFADVPGPDLTWVLGDATYADAPFWLYGTMARYTPRTYALLEYWAAWGMQRAPDTDPDAADCARRPGMRSLLTNGPNWFLADDHEFWNNWPHATVTSRHSYGNMFKALKGMVGRGLGDLRPLGPTETVAPPEDPGKDPKDALVQNYLPVHPDEWGPWIRAAFDLIGSFETRSVRDRETGRITWGERDDDDPLRPPGDGPRGVLHRPLNQVLQTVDLGDVQVALLDTRTRRVRKLHHPTLSTFVDEEYLDELLDLARRAPVFVLAMPEPALVRPAWATDKDPREKLSSDIGIHDYWYQYERFWTGLVAARAGRPTLTVGGDIHRSYVAHVPALSLAEVVASPMSPVFGQALLTLGADGVRRFKNWVFNRTGVADEFAPGTKLVTVDELLRGPAGLHPEPVEGAAVSLACLPRPERDEGGFAMLALSRPEEHLYRLVVQLHQRNDLARGERGTAQTVEFALRTDVRGPGSLTVLSAPDTAAPRTPS